MVSFEYNKLVLNVVEKGENQALVAAQISPELPHLDGHFHDRPIVPGVSQVDLVRKVIETLWASRIRVTAVKRAKFQNLLVPNTEVTIAVNLTQDGQAAWQVFSPDKGYSKGILTYERH